MTRTVAVAVTMVGVAGVPLMASGSTVTATPTARHGVYAYGSAKTEILGAYWYSGGGGGRRPVVVMLHGGYWTGGGAHEFFQYARSWAAAGYVAIDADYRLAPGARWSKQRTDVFKVLSWVRRHAGTLHADTSRIALIGASAGGQIATTAGVYGCATCHGVDAVVGLSPVASPYYSYNLGRRKGADKRHRYLSKTALELAGCHPIRSHEKCWNRWRDMTPQNRASGGDAPLLTFNSAGDLVPYRESAKLARILRDHGVSATAKELDGSKHGSGLLAYQWVRSYIWRWVNRELDAHPYRMAAAPSGATAPEA